MSNEENFRSWLKKNVCGNYQGIAITPESELVCYTYVISAIVITYRKNTSYYFKEAEKGKALAMKLLCILCNLTLGWWGLPWGPIYVIKETFCNLIDSKKAKWGDFLREEE